MWTALFLCAISGTGTSTDERRAENIETEYSTENSQGKQNKISKYTQCMILFQYDLKPDSHGAVRSFKIDIPNKQLGMPAY